MEREPDPERLSSVKSMAKKYMIQRDLIPGSAVTKRKIVKNTIINISGQAIPFLVAIISIPKIIKVLNTERFGVLTLVWGIISYFSLFDFGLGRALTQIIAKKKGQGHEDDIPLYAWTTISILLGIGVLGSLIAIMLSPFLVNKLLVIPGMIRTETLHSFYLLSFFIPVIISSAAFRGILEAEQRFDLVNLIRIPTGIIIFAGPLLVLPFTKSLVGISGILGLGQLFSWLGYWLMCLRVLPKIRMRMMWRNSILKPLFKLGGWMTVSNILSPIMVYLDRFIIGSVVSLAAVSYYTTPFEIVTKIWLIPGALVRVLFPTFTGSYMVDRDRAANLFEWSLKIIFTVIFPIILFLVMFARESLAIWLGPDFAIHSHRVLEILAVGVFLNGFAQIPFSLIQAAGRPDVTGKLHLLEFPLYIVLIWILVKSYGIEGAAMAWVARMVLDVLALLLYSGKLILKISKTAYQTIIILGLSVAVFGFGMSLDQVVLKFIYTIVVLFIFLVTAYGIIIGPARFAVFKNMAKSSLKSMAHIK